MGLRIDLMFVQLEHDFTQSGFCSSEFNHGRAHERGCAHAQIHAHGHFPL